jgi:hypothetical protein
LPSGSDLLPLPRCSLASVSMQRSSKRATVIAR